MGKALRAFQESISTEGPRGVSGSPDVSPAEAVAAHNKRLFEQHAANRALSAARVRATGLEHAIRERKLALGVANNWHELPRSERKAARQAVYDADPVLTGHRIELADLGAQLQAAGDDVSPLAFEAFSFMDRGFIRKVEGVEHGR